MSNLCYIFYIWLAFSILHSFIRVLDLLIPPEITIAFVNDVFYMVAALLGEFTSLCTQPTTWFTLISIGLITVFVLDVHKKINLVITETLK
jgi:hypothetical protein